MMKRKTNLFYTEGPDSKFLTFSNYTEVLTGSYLSVNSKLFPDNFLCLSITNLNSKTKPLFIKYLVDYYENKLAVLRDFNIMNDETIEYDIYPLAYLFEAILKVVKPIYSETEDEEQSIIGYELNVDEETNKLICNNDNFNQQNISNLITYIGQITEEDYYGTYTDIICNINCDEYNEGELEFDTPDLSEITHIASVQNSNNYTKEKLYGWNDGSDFLFGDYENESPIYDEGNTYIFNSNLARLIYKRIDEKSSNYNKTLKFNIIIPLFSMVNTEMNDNYINRTKSNDNLEQYIELNDNNKHCFDVPLGIWLYADEETDTFIELKKDMNLNLYPSWSLLISTQFKPFPYSTYPKQNETSNNPNSNSIGHSYATFSEVLSRMNVVLEKFNKLSIDLNEVNNRIDALEDKINTMKTIENVERIEEKMTNLSSSVNNSMKEFKNEIRAYLNNIKWSSMG